MEDPRPESPTPAAEPARRGSRRRRSRATRGELRVEGAWKSSTWAQLGIILVGFALGAGVLVEVLKYMNRPSAPGNAQLIDLDSGQ